MKYKNISNRDLWLPGIGTLKADEVVEQPDGFNNANFEKVEEADVPKTSEPEKARGFEGTKKRFKTKEK